MNGVLEWALSGSGVAVFIAVMAWLWPRRDSKERRQAECVPSVTTEKAHPRTEAAERKKWGGGIPQPQPSPTKPPPKKVKKQRLVDTPMEHGTRKEVLRVMDMMAKEPENWRGPPCCRHWSYFDRDHPGRRGSESNRLEVDEGGLWIAVGEQHTVNSMMSLTIEETSLVKSALKTLEQKRDVVEKEAQRQKLEDTLNRLEQE